jgi:hypothetical protein
MSGSQHLFGHPLWKWCHQNFVFTRRRMYFLKGGQALLGKRSANKTSAGHRCRCTYVTLPPTIRHTRISGDSRMARERRKTHSL